MQCNNKVHLLGIIPELLSFHVYPKLMGKNGIVHMKYAGNGFSGDRLKSPKAALCDHMLHVRWKLAFLNLLCQADVIYIYELPRPSDRYVTGVDPVTGMSLEYRLQSVDDSTRHLMKSTCRTSPSTGVITNMHPEASVMYNNSTSWTNQCSIAYSCSNCTKVL